jgi:hypothetical protein
MMVCVLAVAIFAAQQQCMQANVRLIMVNKRQNDMCMHVTAECCGCFFIAASCCCCSCKLLLLLLLLLEQHAATHCHAAGGQM